ncbi:hypothetical protein GOV05_05760 [Candidatus Woesearchaeota archaeon]|nr:hypothetical protein [Candidatus Woesearchaeota archaeon]
MEPKTPLRAYVSPAFWLPIPGLAYQDFSRFEKHADNRVDLEELLGVLLVSTLVDDSKIGKVLRDLPSGKPYDLFSLTGGYVGSENINFELIRTPEVDVKFKTYHDRTASHIFINGNKIFQYGTAGGIGYEPPAWQISAFEIAWQNDVFFQDSRFHHFGGYPLSEHRHGFYFHSGEGTIREGDLASIPTIVHGIKKSEVELKDHIEKNSVQF